MPSYPAECLKGITDDVSVQDGLIGSNLFQFRINPDRSDDYLESSINWNDDSNALTFTLAQVKENNIKQFKQGVAILPRNEIDRLRKRASVNKLLSYERQKLEDNPYHGNLVLRQGLHKAIMRTISAGLALASRIEPQSK